MKYYYIFIIVLGCVVVAFSAVIYYHKLIHQEIARRINNRYNQSEENV